MGFPGGLPIKKLPANAEDVGLIPGLVRSPGVGNGNPFFFPQYFCLGNPIDRESWWATVLCVCSVAKLCLTLCNLVDTT